MVRCRNRMLFLKRSHAKASHACFIFFKIINYPLLQPGSKQVEKNVISKTIFKCIVIFETTVPP